MTEVTLSDRSRLSTVTFWIVTLSFITLCSVEGTNAALPSSPIIINQNELYELLLVILTIMVTEGSTYEQLRCHSDCSSYFR